MATSPLAPRRNRWIFAACWMLWSVVHFFMLQNFDISPLTGVADSLLSNALLAAAAVLIIHTLGYYRPEKRKYIYLLVWVIVVSALWSAAVRYILGSLFEDDGVYTSFLDKSMPIRFDMAFLVSGCAAITSMLWYDLEEQKMRESRKSDAEKLSRDAELYKLRQQLQPHFLFNSLNSISALAGNHPGQARKMIQQLSQFLRAALKKEDHEWVTLREEFEHLQLYLDMEKMRFGHRLSTDITHDDHCLHCFIPPMLLQPVVENAIKFGLYDTTESVVISINAVSADEYLVVTVTNPFNAESAVTSGTGFGLTSVKRRLYLLFARNDLLSTSTSGDLFTTTVKIPTNDIHHPD